MPGRISSNDVLRLLTIKNAGDFEAIMRDIRDHYAPTDADEKALDLEKSRKFSVDGVKYDLLFTGVVEDGYPEMLKHSIEGDSITKPMTLIGFEFIGDVDWISRRMGSALFPSTGKGLQGFTLTDDHELSVVLRSRGINAATLSTCEPGSGFQYSVEFRDLEGKHKCTAFLRSFDQMSRFCVLGFLNIVVSKGIQEMSALSTALEGRCAWHRRGDPRGEADMIGHCTAFYVLPGEMGSDCVNNQLLKNFRPALYCDCWKDIAIKHRRWDYEHILKASSSIGYEVSGSKVEEKGEEPKEE